MITRSLPDYWLHVATTRCTRCGKAYLGQPLTTLIIYTGPFLTDNTWEHVDCLSGRLLLRMLVVTMSERVRRGIIPGGW